MLMTMKEILEVRKCLREGSAALTEVGKEYVRIQICLHKVSAVLTKIEKMLNSEMTILGVPGQFPDEDEFELESGQVEYDEEQCARNK